MTQDIDLNQVRSELKPLLELKADPEALDKLERMIATVERRLRAKLQGEPPVAGGSSVTSIPMT